MPCGCTAACGCTILGDGSTTTHVTVGDTTTISAIQTFLGVLDTPSIDMTLAAGIVSSVLRLDPASPSPLSITAAGLRVDCCAFAGFAIADTNTVDLDTSGGTLTANVIPNTLAGIENQVGGVSIKLEGDPAAIAPAAGQNVLRFTTAGDLTLHDGLLANSVGAYVRSVTPGSPVFISGPVGTGGTSLTTIVTNTDPDVTLYVRLSGVATLNSVSTGVVGTNRIWSIQSVLNITATTGGATSISSNGLYTVTEMNSNVIAAGSPRTDRGHLERWARIPPGGSVTFTAFTQTLIAVSGWATAVVSGGSFTFENVTLLAIPSKTGGYLI